MVLPVPTVLTSCSIISPILTSEEDGNVFRYNDLTDEYWVWLYISVEPIEVGFLTIPIWANLVSIGKSFVESSNLA